MTGGRAFLWLVLLTPAACGKKAEGPEKATIRYLSSPDVGGASKEIIRRFEALHPGVRIEMVEGPGATNVREDMYATSFMAEDDTYDLVYMDVVWLPKFAGQGWLRPLDDRFTPAMQREFLPGDIEGSRFGGRIYRVPAQADGGVLYYRKDLLAAAGLLPPDTWEELVRIARRLQRPPGLWGYVFQGKQYEGLVCAYLEMLWGEGGEVLSEDGEVLLDRPEAVRALQRLVDAVHSDRISPEGVLTYEEEDARRTFQEGRAVFMRNWPYAWNLLQGEGSPVRGKVGMLPMARGRGRNAATLGGWGFGISAFSRHPEEAWEFIRFAMRPENQKLAFFKGGISPTLESLYRDPEVLAAAPYFRELLRVLRLARPRPVHPRYARISDILQMHVSAALSRQEEPAAALRAAARELRAVLGR